MNRNHKVMFLLATLIMLLVSISAISAVNSSSNATVEQVTATNTQTDNIIADTQDNVKADNNNIKTIEKNIKNTKTKPETSVDYYVSDSQGSDDNDGSQETPFKTIGAAIDKTTADNVYNIYIKEGTYKGVGNTNLTVNGTYFVNFIGDGVDKTIIDGEANFTIPDHGNTAWGGSGLWDYWRNASGNWFLNITAGNGSFVVDNFKIQNAWSDSGSNIGLCYAATIDNYANLKATNMYFYNNHAGAGAGIRNGYKDFNPSATLYVDNCTFENNTKSATTGNFGAAVYNNATAIINNSVIYHNYARWGSVTTDKTMYVYNTRFSENIGYDAGSGFKNGPTLYANTGNADFFNAYDSEGLLLHIENCTFTENEHCDINFGNASARIINNTFNASTGVYITGGARDNHNIVIANNTFTDMRPSAVAVTLTSTTKPSWAIYTLSSIQTIIENNTINVPNVEFGYGIYVANNNTIKNNTMDNNIWVTGKNNTILNNSIVTDKNYAIGGTTAGTNNTIQYNYLVASVADGDDSVNLSSNNIISDNLPQITIYNITDETYSQFFNEDGTVIDGKIVNSSKIMLVGTFNNKDFTFTKDKIAIVGSDALLLNSTITGSGDSQISISNITINNTGVDKFSAVVFNSSKPGRLTTSKIFIDTDNKVNAVVLASDKSTVAQTVIDVTAKAYATDYSQVGDVWVGLGSTVGLAIRSSNNIINVTNVSVTAKNTSDNYASTYAIDMQSGNPNVILTGNILSTNSRFNATSTNTGYSYGLNAIGITKTVSSGMWINVTSDNYACGLQLSGESSDNQLAGYIYSTSDDVAYAAYVSNMGGNGLNNNNLSKLYLQNITGKNAVGFQLEGVNGTLIGNQTNIGFKGQQNTIVNITNSNNTVIYGLTYNNKVDTNENSTFIIANNIDGIKLYLNNWNSTAGKGIILNNAKNINISNNYFNLYNTIGGNDAIVTDNPDAILVNNTPSIKVITEETYSNFFDENGVLKEDIVADILSIGSDITGKDMIINRDVNLKNAGSYVLYNTTLIFNGSWPSGNYASPKTNVTGIIIDNVNKTAIVTDIDNDYQYNLLIEDCSIKVTGDNVLAVNSTQTAGTSYVYLSLSKDNITVTGKNATVLFFSGNHTGNSVKGVGEIRNCKIDVTAEDTSIVYDAQKENVYFTYNTITQSGANAYTIKAENYGMDDWQYNNITITADNAVAFQGENKITTYTDYIRYNNINITSDNPTTAINMINSNRITVNYYNNITVSSDNGETPVVLLDGTNTVVTNNYIAANDIYGDDAASALSVSNNRPVDTTITAESTVVALGENTTITGKVTAGNAVIADATLTLTCGDELVEAVTGADGTFTASMKTFADNKEVTISAPLTYNGKPATETITIETVKPNTEVVVEPLTVTVGETTSITALVTASDDSVVTDGKVYFKVNGKVLRGDDKKVIYVDVADGSATITDISTDVWDEYTTIQAAYVGSDNFNKSTSEVANPEISTSTSGEPTLTVEDQEAVAGEEITIKVDLQNVDDLNTGKVVLKVNGKTVKSSEGKLYAKVVDGSVTFTYAIPKTLKSGEYTIKAVYTNASTKLEADATLKIGETN